MVHLPHCNNRQVTGGGPGFPLLGSSLPEGLGEIVVVRLGKLQFREQTLGEVRLEGSDRDPPILRLVNTVKREATAEDTAGRGESGSDRRGELVSAIVQ